MTTGAAASPGARRRPSLRVAQKEMTRRLLLTTAMELFESRGYPATTIDDIANAAGTTRVTFYAHFPARIDLIRALFADLNAFLQRDDTEGVPSDPTLVAAVRSGSRAAIAAWIDRSASRWPTVQPYLRVADEAAITDPEIRALADRWWDEAYRDLVMGMDQAGRFDPATRRTRAELAFAQLHHLATSWLRRGWQVADADAELGVLTDGWLALVGDGLTKSISDLHYELFLDIL
jgi:AcrR family transcriptional regulator